MASPFKMQELQKQLKPGEFLLPSWGGMGGSFIISRDKNGNATVANRKPDRKVTATRTESVGREGRQQTYSETFGVYSSDPASEGTRVIKKKSDTFSNIAGALAMGLVGGGALLAAGAGAAGAAGGTAAKTATAAAGTAGAAAGTASSGLSGWGAAALGLGAGMVVPSLLAKNPKLPPPPTLGDADKPTEMPMIDSENILAQKRTSVARQRRRGGRQSTIMTGVSTQEELLGG